MKNIIKTVSYGLLIGLIACEPDEKPQQLTRPETAIEEQITTQEPARRTKKIKLAILLDTSGSMKGLIEQAKNQLWKIVNQLALAKDEYGEDPEIELALYQYGNDGLSAMDGYVQQISGFTSELDEISEQLFALQTNGGSEYCGAVINDAIGNLEWSSNEEDLQIIFIAGNEEFSQGPESYADACRAAVGHNVIVNTIFCGDYGQGERTQWNDGAVIGQGKYMNIDHDAQIVHVNSPYDEEIIALNERLNKTYIPYGSHGTLKKQKQLEQDANASQLSSANAAKRYISKGSKVYKNTSWDLVDASDKAGFDVNKIEGLPENMRSMTTVEKENYIASLREKRKEVKSKISKLSKERTQYVVNEKLKADPKASQLDDVIVAAIKEQAIQKAYYFE